MEDIINIIKNNQLFDNIREDEIEQIIKCSNAQVVEYENNQLVFQKDDIIKNLGIVIEGQLNLISQKYSGAMVIVTTLKQNDLFGEALAFSTLNRAPYDLVSSGRSRALVFPYNVFFAMCDHVCAFHKTLIGNMLSILSDKITMLNNKMHILNAETLRGRIAVYFLMLHDKSNSLIFDIPMKRQELADFLNVKRPSLSRELSNMQKDEIIEIYRSTIKITNLEKLRESSD